MAGMGIVALGAEVVKTEKPAAVAAAPAQPSAEGVEFFEKHIRPVLIERCYECHSAAAPKVKGGLLLDSKEGVLKGGDSGAVIVPGEPEKSLLIKAIRYHEKGIEMPPKSPLAPEQIARFEQWVKMGAPDPRVGGAAAVAPPRAPAYDYAKAKEFWSLKPVKAPALPPVKDAEWVKSPVDVFVLAKLEEKGLKPAKAADRRVLIRRATFDLIGLPPTPDEVEAFVQDTSPNAFEKVVDRLLASPHYGEKWGRHWLDVVRYADTAGCNSDYPVPSAHRYRNYVIDSFNRDKPYDQFLREQIAGDLLPAASEEDRYEKIIATGYLAISRRFGSRNNEFHLTIEDTIDNVGKAMLGLSVSCARCHDHKFDPIPQSDYYALSGICDSTKYAFPGTEIYKTPRDFVFLAPPEDLTEIRETEKELAALPDTIERLQGVKNRYKARMNTLEKQETLSEAEEKELKEAKLKMLEAGAELSEAISKQRKLENEREQIKVEKAYAVSEEEKPANAKIHRKGEPRNLGDVVPRGFLQVLGGQKLSEGNKGSGRDELAGWITDPRNPLTARVMVNRIWQGHFGKGIVQTPNDFGVRGQPPTHPDLLDFLAHRFVEEGWSVKKMHRLIMLSSAYQMGSAFDGSNAAVDPNNDYLWRQNPRRLSAEEIRDSMLAVSGLLDDEVGGGAHPFPPEGEWKYTQHRQFFAVYDTKKRSVYLMQQRLKKHPLLEVFDGADPNAPTGTRSMSTTPVQALYAMNNKLVHEVSDALAVRVSVALTEEPARIDYAHRLALGRPASEEETRLAAEYLSETRAKLKETGMAWDKQTRAAMASYLRMVLASNEFFFVD